MGKYQKNIEAARSVTIMQYLASRSKTNTARGCLHSRQKKFYTTPTSTASVRTLFLQRKK